MLKKYLNDNFIKKFIRLNHSLAASLIFFIWKLNENLRLCVNYRALNAIIIKNRCLLSLIQKTLSRIYKTRIYIIFDIIVVFNKLRIIERKKWKTVFKTRYDLYESFIINFDLCEALFSFQNYINDVLHEYLDDFYTIYIDNILIYNENRKKHIWYIRLIFQRLKNIDFQINIQKCSFKMIEIKYLDLIIIINEIRINMKKVIVILNWSTSKNVKNVQSFLNFVNFYRRFIQKFSRFVDSLIQLIKKNHKFE